MDLIHIDFVKMEIPADLRKKPKTKNILVVIDHFTRFVQAYVTKDQMARTVAKILYDRYFSVFGFPRRLMSDQARAFCGAFITQMCDYLRIDKIRTSPYHPQSNGQVEQVHQTLLRMIGKLEEERRRDWPTHLGSVVHTYNTTRSLVTGFSAHYLMFGRRPRITIDLLFPMIRRLNMTKTLDEYVTALYRHLRQALSKARDTAFQEARHHKRVYNRKAGAVALQPGDNVLVKMDAFRGQRRKLKNQWSDDIWMVVCQVADDVSAYVVRNSRTGKTKVLHRACLLLCLADYTQDGLEVNVLSLEDDVVPCTTLRPIPYEGGEGGTPLEILYGLDLVRFSHSLDISAPTMDHRVHGMPTGASQQETSLETMDVNEVDTQDAAGKIESEDVPSSPATLAAMEF